ncbi:hypothetical protein KACHI17_03370 [Sediminibacterium sp. KACHI17]|jgi:hypothetical protein|uniref:Uncharacterized protein n=1 Tax=Sediminibacterium sp. KACHI17 TaxID=1751071 RepID=A0AAT9GG14_9BACT
MDLLKQLQNFFLYKSYFLKNDECSIFMLNGKCIQLGTFIFDHRLQEYKVSNKSFNLKGFSGGLPESTHDQRLKLFYG